MSEPSDNPISQQETTLKEPVEPKVIHVILEDEGVKADDKIEEICDKAVKKSSPAWDYFEKIVGCPVGKEKAKYEVKAVGNSLEYLDIDEDD